MATAQTIVTTALRDINRLSPGETLDADTGDWCLTALNAIVDEFNGSGLFLWREVLTAGTVTSSTGTIGTTWALSPGIQILGASYNDGTEDCDLHVLTMAQYQGIADKTLAEDPSCYAYDGYATVYFYPVPTSRSVTLRTKAEVTAFADLTTDYGMPPGYQAWLGYMLAERVAPSLIGDVPRHVAINSANSKRSMLSRNMKPSILRGGYERPSIFTG